MNKNEKPPFNSNVGLLSRRLTSIKVRYGPSGIHLFSRSNGANLLIDEFVPPVAKWATAPRQVSIALTNACDLTCPYCYAPKIKSMLPFDSVVSWLNELDANGTLGVGFGGGEPTLYPRFAELCIHVATKTRLAVTFTTHAHHLDDALLGRLKGSVHFVRVSMDGVHATYERLRGRSFVDLKKRIDSIAKVLPFGINYVVNADTFPDIDSAISIAENVGASEFLLLPERPAKDRPGIDDAILGQLRTWVFQYAGKVRLAISEESAAGLPVCDPFINEPELFGYAHVDAGALLKATSFASTGIPIESDGVLKALSKLKQQQPY